MSYTRNGIYHSNKKPESQKKEEINNIQNKIAEMFDCISLLTKKTQYSSLSQKDKKQITEVCAEEKIQMKEKNKKTYLSTEAISENLMDKIHGYDKKLEKLMPKKEYNEYGSRLIKEEFAKQMSKVFKVH